MPRGPGIARAMEGPARALAVGPGRRNLLTMGEGDGLPPRGDALRRALQWLAERRQEDPKASRAKLISEAGLRFDLSPAEEEFLFGNWKES
jgi:hypothetical protein